MAKDQWTFQNLQAATSLSSPSDEEFYSTSDESEAIRFADTLGVGEVLVSYEDDARELGFIND